ncbi:MAG: peptidylprolyl isomerase [Saprospiraceae bacterium]|nr:peptidylprolyl isomerase [Saprospiraceae bacterium]
MSWRFILLCVLGLGALNACNKDDDDAEPQLPPAEQLAIDIKVIEDYLAAEGLSAEKTSSGLHYIIKEAGDGNHPSPTDSVEVKYTGYLTDKTLFDRTLPAQTVVFSLSRVIPGWTEGIPLLETGGGKGTLLLPSHLGYGNNPPQGSVIGRNEVLIFDVTLLSIK